MPNDPGSDPASRMTVEAPPDLRIDPDDWAEAISKVDGPQIVVAGPGTGKTEFLVRRARHLIGADLAQPGEVLVLTFSRRNSADIKNRSRVSNRQPVIATFHSFAYRLLETFAEREPPSEPPTLLTGPEQVALVADLLKTEIPSNWPSALRRLLSSNTLAAEVSDFLLRCQERMIDRDQLRSLVDLSPRWEAIPQFMDRYQGELKRRNRLDYGTLLARATALLDLAEVRQALSEQYRYVLVDEYQDTSAAQVHLLERLTSEHRNITVTGDPYQSIYSFRGADLENVERFPARFRDLTGPPAQRLILTTSFRVPAQILDGALRVVSSGELPGGAGPVIPAPHAGRVEAFVFDQASGEADWIAGRAERLHLEEGIAYKAIGVLVRSTRHLFPELSRALDRRHIPHLRPDRRLTDHAAMRMIFDLAWAAFAGGLAVSEPGWGEETDRAVRRLLLGPLFELPLGQERELLRTRRRTGRTWPEVLSDEHVGSEEFRGLLADSAWSTSKPAIEGFRLVWTTLPELVPLIARPDLAEYRRAFTEFAQVLDQQRERDPAVSLVRYQQLASQDDFEAVPLLSLRPGSEEQLTLTTLHQAKGIEFDVVFIADAAEGVFPNLSRRNALLRPELLSVGPAAESQVRFRLQEEMRLAYTAMTRARSRVIWTATAAAIDEGERRPSRFLLAAAGVDSFEDLNSPRVDPVPVTAAEAEAQLRLLLTNPATPSSERLAALQILAHPPQADLWKAESFAGVAERGPDHGVVAQPLRMNPTSAQAYDKCPRRFVLENLLEATGSSTPYASYGSLVHKVLEDAETAAIARGEGRSTAEEAKQILDRVWAEGADFGSPVLNEAWRRRGEGLIERLYQNWPTGDAIALKSEHTVTLDIENVVWRGRIDRVEEAGPDQIRIVDYKTGKKQPTVAEAATSLQLAFYLLAAQIDPVLSKLGQPTEAELWHPEADQPRRSFKLENLPGAINRLGEVAGSILKEDWTPRPGAHCEQCTVRLVCPAWPEGREGFRS